VAESDPGHRAVRLDKWLWAARFFKTRSLASQAVAGGKIEVNGDRAKRSKLLQIGDEIRVRHGPFEHRVHVRALSENRGPAPVAAALYQETAASINARQVLSAQLKLARVPRFEGKGRPTKKDRRLLEKIREVEVED
jgi:ribosome-associated heat shock protein Hsp15